MSLKIFDERMSETRRDDLAFELHLMLDPKKRRQIKQCTRDIENGSFVTKEEIFAR